MENVILALVIAAILALAVGYIYKAKKKGAKCIGCPDSGTCGGSCAGCAGGCEHTPMEELMALMKYMAGHNAAHAKELADLAIQLEKAGNHAAYEQVMAAVSDFEKGNMRLSLVLASMQ